MPSTRWGRRRSSGQAIAEFALVFPIAALVLFGIISLGLTVFFQFQLTNVAREAARHAGIHSSTAVCATTSWRDPASRVFEYQPYPYQCDGPNNPNDSIPWPWMTAYARSYAWGMKSSAVMINACWSGYVNHGISTSGYASYAAPFPQADSPAVDTSTSPPTPNTFVQCTIDRVDPIANPDTLDCRSRMTSAADDPASDLAGNQVTVYACYVWRPPLAGFLLIPSQITLRSVVTEVIQSQQ
jgi:hypothetical protein